MYDTTHLPLTEPGESHKLLIGRSTLSLGPDLSYNGLGDLRVWRPLSTGLIQILSRPTPIVHLGEILGLSSHSEMSHTLSVIAPMKNVESPRDRPELELVGYTVSIPTLESPIPISGDSPPLDSNPNPADWRLMDVLPEVRSVTHT